MNGAKTLTYMHTRKVVIRRNREAAAIPQAIQCTMHCHGRKAVDADSATVATDVSDDNAVLLLS